jgi:hypothetical protein
MSLSRDELMKAIWQVEAEDHGSFTLGVKSEVAYKIADAMIPLLAQAREEGRLAGCMTDGLKHQAGSE